MPTASTGAWSAAERRRLVGLCAAITRDRVAAEDLAQETLLEAWRSDHKVHDPSGRDRWLAAIARNVCLRFGRRRGRDLARTAAVSAEPCADDATLDAQLESLELAAALGRLTPLTRQVLEQRYVEDQPHAEIARRTGLSSDAVSMRISRGTAELRHLLDGPGFGRESTRWSGTRLWCSQCGTRRLEIQHDPHRVAFRCRSCNDGVSSEFDLTNPAFALVFGDLVQPAAILGRAARWSSAYFAAGARHVPCTRCGRSLTLRRYEARGRDGLAGLCRSCGEAISCSAEGLAQATGAVRELRRRHPRARLDRRWTIEREGVPATVIRFAAPTSSATADVVLARDTLRLLTVS